MIALYLIGMFLLDLARIVDASEELVRQAYRTNNLLVEIVTGDVMDVDDDDDVEDEEVNDLGELESRVAKAFSNDPILGPLLIDTDIEALDGGVIELAGPVKNHEVWDHMVNVTSGVEGVNEVISLLTIRPVEDHDEIGDQTSKSSGTLPGLEDLDLPDVRTGSEIFHSIPGPMGKTWD